MEPQRVLLRAGGARPARVHDRQAQPPRTDERLKDVESAEEVLWSIGMTDVGWTAEPGDEKDGIRIWSRDCGSLPKNLVSKAVQAETQNNSYKVWKCCGEVQAPAADVLHLMSDVEQMPRWNKQVSSYKILERIDAQTDIVQCVSQSGASGTVSPRDFIIVRRRSSRSGAYLLSSVTPSASGGKHAAATNTGYVRGWHGPGGFIIRSTSAPSSKVQTAWVCWVMNMDLRGWLPRSWVDGALAGILIEWLKTVRHTLQQRRKSVTCNSTASVKAASGVPTNLGVASTVETKALTQPRQHPPAAAVSAKTRPHPPGLPSNASGHLPQCRSDNTNATRHQPATNLSLVSSVSCQT